MLSYTIDGKAVTLTQVKDWTKPSKNEWCRWVCDTSQVARGMPGTLSPRW